MIKLVEVKAKPNYRLWLRYEDGAQGELDLSNLVGQGVFSFWNDPANFERVYIGESGQISWSDELDICPDSAYMDITGKKCEEIYPGMKQEKTVA